MNDFSDTIIAIIILSAFCLMCSFFCIFNAYKHEIWQALIDLLKK